MFNCPNCQKELEDGTKFCDDCGAQIVETIFCPNCGQQTSNEFAFCQVCGASLAEEAVAAPEKKPGLLSKLPFKLSKKLMTIGAAALAAIVLVIIILSIALSGGKKNNYILYIKDKEIQYTQVSKIKPWTITEKLLDMDAGENENRILSQYASSFGYYIQMSKDGKTLFYVDKISALRDAMTLYYRSATNQKKEPEKIDSDVTDYTISENGKLVTYLKQDGETKTLYQHNLKDKEKIASEVSSYRVSSDGKTLIWKNKDGDLYMQKSGKDKEKLDSEIDYIEHINEKFDTIWYTKEDAFYKRVLKKDDKQKLASDVETVLAVYDSGEFYYTKGEAGESKLYSFVDDDLAESDAAMKEPVQPTYPEYPNYPSYPSYYAYETTEAYQAAVDEYNKKYEEMRNAYNDAVDKYNQESDKYYEARSEWYNKQSRDELREELKEASVETTTYKLYFNNGKEDKELAANYSDYSRWSYEVPMLIYSAAEKGEVVTVKMSEISSRWDVENKITEANDGEAKKYIALKGEATEIKEEDAQSFRITDDAKAVYYIADIEKPKEDSEEAYIPHGELKKLTISGTKVKKAETYDKDVYADSLNVAEDGKVLYYKEYKEGKGELYIDKKKVADDVHNYLYNQEEGTVACIVDWNGEKGQGTLKLWKKGKLEKVDDDVRNMAITPNGELLYLKDYSTKSFKGDLYMLKGNKPKKIDEDVVAIIPVYSYDD